MLQVQPTHIGLDIAGRIFQELQPETSVHITDELLEIVNAKLNQSIGLENANLYRIADSILTLIPFKQEILERIIENNADDNMDIYLIHLIDHSRFCYCIPFQKNELYKLNNSGPIEYSKINL